MAELGLAHERRPANVDDIIIKNWKALIKPEDLVIHLGDVYFTSGIKYPIADLLKELPGRKWLTVGNHDPRSVSAYLDMGFDFAGDGILVGGVYYTHLPQRKLPYGACLNVHGHLHSRYPRGVRVWPHCRLFSLEYEKFMPRKLESFLRDVEREKPFVPDHYKDFDTKVLS